jgi:hypothetical protein
MTPTYVYGLVHAGATVPGGLCGLEASGVRTVVHDQLAALVSDVPSGRALGTRNDLLAHERVVNTMVATTAVLPMRFPGLAEGDSIVDELLVPNHDRLLAMLEELDGRVQFTVKGRYEQDVVLREVISDRPEILELRDRVQELPEDAGYYDRIRLGELVVGELEARRDEESVVLHDRLGGGAVAAVARPPSAPEEVLNSAFLIERDHQDTFEAAVEALGAELAGRVRLRMIGPVAAYDFVPEE